MDGEYIADRLLPSLVTEASTELGITCTPLSDGWVIELKNQPNTKWVVGYHFDINGAAAAMVAKDKVAAYQALSRSGVPAVPHYLARSVASAKVPYAPLHQADHSVPYIVKPLHGSGGRRFTRYSTLNAALAAICLTPGDWAVSPTVTITREKRLIMLDKEPLLAYVKTIPRVVDGVMMYNLGHGAVPIDEAATNDEIRLAQGAMDACGLRLAAVDIVTLAGGEQCVLEVNAGIMMEYYARQSSKHLHRAARVYRAIIAAMFATDEKYVKINN